ncbi:MAG TPA: hypothetical protein VF076_07985 [Acidimicrobiales bacterium]
MAGQPESPPDPRATQVASAADPPATRSATADQASPTSADETIEAVQAVIRAAVDVGRQLLDAVERALDDPATADRLAEVVGGFSSLVDGLRRAAPGPGGGRPPRSGEVERIEVS